MGRVRRLRDPFPGYADCGWREECFQLSPQPTVLWQWQRCGVLGRDLALTPRGEIVSAFLGSEWLALAAALEAELIFDYANLFANDRFAETNPRRLGRLAAVCERVYLRLTIEDYLVEGLPPQYGFGGSDVVHGWSSARSSPEKRLWISLKTNLGRRFRGVMEENWQA